MRLLNMDYVCDWYYYYCCYHYHLYNLLSIIFPVPVFWQADTIKVREKLPNICLSTILTLSVVTVSASSWPRFPSLKSDFGDLRNIAFRASLPEERGWTNVCFLHRLLECLNFDVYLRQPYMFDVSSPEDLAMSLKCVWTCTATCSTHAADWLHCLHADLRCHFSILCFTCISK